MKRVSSILLFAMFSSPLLAATYTVDTTVDTALTLCTAAANDCSLRGALGLLNTSNVDLVRFNIPMTDPGCVAATGVCTIQLLSNLPDINPGANGLVTIDGYTQPGALPNTQTPDQGGSNAAIKIVVRGGPGISRAISFVRHGTLRGLAIGNVAGGAAVSFSSVGSGGIVEGCFIGTDASGTSAIPNQNGIVADGNPFGGATSSNVRIGGLLPAQRNVISGNAGQGIVASGINHQIFGNLIGTNASGTAAIGNRSGVALGGGTNFSQILGNGSAAGRNVISGNNTDGVTLAGAGAANAHRIIGNFFGTDVTGTLPLGNGTVGVSLNNGPSGGPQLALVGGTVAGEANVIAFNGTQGVATRNSRGQVLGNRIFANGQLGISSRAGDNGSTDARLANDPGDPDGPANLGQNFPELSAFALSGNNANLSYRVDSLTTNSAYPIRVEFYKADGDEGRELIGIDSYLAIEAASVKSISLPIPIGMALGLDDVIVATATDANGNTSEFSFQPITMVIEQPVPSACGGNVRIFCDAFESNPQRSLEITLRATNAMFKPNGVVRLSDDRGASCTLNLAPISTPLTSSGSCVLANSGAPGPITITAVYDTFTGAFGNVVTGDNVTQNANFVIPSN